MFIRPGPYPHAMASGIRTEIGIGTPGECPVARASDDAGTTIDRVARSSAAGADGTVTEEFTVDAAATFDDPVAEQVFDHGSSAVYRFDRERCGCVCERIERHDCPVSDLHARDGALYVSFYAPDVATVRDIVADLRDWFGDIRVRQLTHAGEDADHDFVFVDRGRLTDRQREVLETSYEMGYFDHPKRANAGDVAAALDIAPATFSEHLAAAQRKLLDSLLETQT